MTFRAADSDRRVTDNIIGERNIRHAVPPEIRPSQAIVESPGDSGHQNTPVPAPTATAAASGHATPPKATILAPKTGSDIGQDDFVATDLQKRKENINATSPSETKKVPPHLRRNKEMLQTSQDFLPGPSDKVTSDKVTKPSREDLNKTVEPSNGIPVKPPQSSLQKQTIQEIPQTPAATKKAAKTAADTEDTEDRQEQTWFTSWGKREERERPCE